MTAILTINLIQLHTEAHRLLDDGETDLEHAYVRAVARISMRAAESTALEAFDEVVMRAVRQAQYNNQGLPVQLGSILNQMEIERFQRKKVERVVRRTLPDLRRRGLLRSPSARTWSVPDAEYARSKIAA